MYDADYWHEWWEERAAILQYENRFSRIDAEKAAQRLMDAARRRVLDADRGADIPSPAAIQGAACGAPADYGGAGDPAPRLDTGACHGRAAQNTGQPYAVVAARAGPVYLAAMKTLKQTLPKFRNRGVTP